MIKIVVCLDDNNGLMFNKRRQSQDFFQRDDLYALIGEEKLYLSDYSYELYSELPFNFGNLKENKDEKNGYFLFEDIVFDNIIENAEEIICYFWNRDYPTDVKFEIHENGNWKVKEEKEIAGSSHDLITRKIYKRR